MQACRKAISRAAVPSGWVRFERGPVEDQLGSGLWVRGEPSTIAVACLELGTATRSKAVTVIPAPSLIVTLGDALHLVDAMDDIEAELADAEDTVKRSQEFTLSATTRLREETQRFQSEKDLCSKLVRDCERRLRRQYLARVCIETALVPFHVLFDVFWCTPRRALLRRKIQRRIQALDTSIGGLSRLQARIDSMNVPLPLASPKAGTGLVGMSPAFPRRKVSSRGMRRASNSFRSAEEPAPVLGRA